jgi:imidazolonepropionase-like amidohydrolase
MSTLIKYFLLGSMLLTPFVGAKSIAIVGAKVHTMSSQGTVDNATVLIKDGKIQKVIQGEVALAGYEIIDAKGKVVTPGLIGASTSLGLVDVGFSAGTNDSNSSLTSISATGAAFDVSYAINPDSALMAIARIEGVTSAATSMGRTGQLFNGQGALISLGDTSKSVIQARAFISTRSFSKNSYAHRAEAFTARVGH